MKRHPSLRDLSMDHHHGLVHARRLLKTSAPAGEQDDGDPHARETVLSFLQFFAEHTNAHFREEEEVLLPAFARHGNPAEPPIVQMLVEHVQIRRLVKDLQSQVDSGPVSSDTMAAAGSLLQAHIRLEEDVVFPLIERAMPEDALVALAQELAGFVSSEG